MSIKQPFGFTAAVESQSIRICFPPATVKAEVCTVCPVPVFAGIVTAERVVIAFCREHFIEAMDELQRDAEAREST